MSENTGSVRELAVLIGHREYESDGAVVRDAIDHIRALEAEVARLTAAREAPVSEVTIEKLARILHEEDEAGMYEVCDRTSWEYVSTERRIPKMNRARAILTELDIARSPAEST